MEKTHTHYLIVKRHIDALDYCGLLAMHAPHDEFDRESRQIAERITLDHTAKEIEAIIADVMYTAFAPASPAADFHLTAQRIRDDLCAYFRA